MKQKALIEEVNAPVRKFKAGAVFAAIWSNKGQNDGEYKTISLERRYTDKEGNWKSTTSFRANDLPKVQLVMQKAYEFIVLNEEQAVGA